MSASCSVHSGASKEYRELMKGGLGNGLRFTHRKKPVWKWWGKHLWGARARGFLVGVVPAAGIAAAKKRTEKRILQIQSVG